MRPLWISALAGVIACSSSNLSANDGGKKGKDGGDPTETPGPSTTVPTGPTSGCPGSPNSTAFRVFIDEFVVDPYKPDQQPWDWDGTVPDWLLTSIGILAQVIEHPYLQTADAILNAIDEHAPDLLDGTVPPDPQLWVNIDGGTYGYYPLGSVDTDDDTYTPAFYSAVDITLYPGEVLYIDLWDEDLTFDDEIGSEPFTEEDLRYYAGCGTLTFAGWPGTGIYSFQVEVVPLD